MNSPLNPVLYERLCQEFGRATIVNPGVAASRVYSQSAYRPRCSWGPQSSGTYLKMNLNDTGEYYRVNCPFCGDSRGRLWINHLWGAPDENTGSKNLWLAICYNENCIVRLGHRERLYDMVYGFKNAKVRGRQVQILPGEIEDNSLKPVMAPGDLLPLSRIPAGHPVHSYLVSRGYDPVKLYEDFSISYCLEALPEYPMANGRLVVPVVMDGTLVGWQCRYVGDINWKESRIPKYYTRPGMPKRLVLYNYDNAKKFPYVVVTEGPSDVWNVGKPAVAAFGKHLSVQQMQLLCRNWRAVVILLDGDAWDDAQEVATKLKANAPNDMHIIPVQLPPDRDPGDLDPELLWALIRGTAATQGIDLDAIERNESYDYQRTAPTSHYRATRTRMA